MDTFYGYNIPINIFDNVLFLRKNPSKCLNHKQIKY